MMRNMTCLLTVLLSVPALGQITGTYLLTSTNAVSPGAPTTTIGVWATWTDPNAEWVLAAGNYDLTAGDGVFWNPVNVLNGHGSSTGVIAGNVISGALNGQFHIPQIGLLASRDNPILLATYEWSTTDFTPRSVSLDTGNTFYFAIAWWDPQAYFIMFDPPFRRLFPGAFSPASGVINVVPAPAAWLVLALPLAAATRRRRC